MTEEFTLRSCVNQVTQSSLAIVSPIPVHLIANGPKPIYQFAVLLPIHAVIAFEQDLEFCFGFLFCLVQSHLSYI